MMMSLYYHPEGKAKIFFLPVSDLIPLVAIMCRRLKSNDVWQLNIEV